MAIPSSPRSERRPTQCIGLGSHRSLAGQSLLLLIRAAAHQPAGETGAAYETFHEAGLTQQPETMPHLFLTMAMGIRNTLWGQVPRQRKSGWNEIRRFPARGSPPARCRS